jgi:hypothetical protein
MIGANSLPPLWRERYLASVQDNLLSLGRSPNDDDVHRVVADVRFAFTPSVSHKKVGMIGSAPGSRII